MPVGAVHVQVNCGAISNHLVSYTGLFIIMLVVGMLQIYHAPADRVALNLPMLTSESVDANHSAEDCARNFSLVDVPLPLENKLNDEHLDINKSISDVADLYHRYTK